MAPGLQPGAKREALPPEPYPLRAAAERALLAAANPPAGWQPLGYTAADYLTLLRGICSYFRACQDERGAIVDPYAGEEKQYATPCFAVAAALVALDGRPPAGVWGPSRREAGVPPGDPGLLEEAARAQDHALRSLAVEKNTAQNHADFFAPLVVLGYQLLTQFVPRERARRWLAELRSIDPETIYRDTFKWKADHTQPPTVHNWSVVAVAGEILRHAAGAGSDLPWVQHYLDYQLGANCDLEWGLYRDPNCPLPYDLFPRHHLGYALATIAHQADIAGDGSGPSERAALPAALWRSIAGWLHRGEWTSALTQTGSGGIPPGWRSSEHLWNDAALVALAEVAAARHARAGHAVAGRLFRRVATLAFRSMLHWQRPSGELHVVKNHIDPAWRHGFEGYSFHSNYGLYPAAMLATALLFGDCQSAEAPAPVETGSYVVRYPDPFHRLTATHTGLTLAFDLDADGHYDVTGLNSIRRLHAHPLLGPASGLPAHPRYHVPQTPDAAYAPGLQWTSPEGEAVSLAVLHPRGVELHLERQDASGLAFSLRYAVQAAGCESIISHYRLTAGGVEAEEHFTGAPASQETLAFVYPYPLDDGLDRSSTAIHSGSLQIRLGQSTQHLTVQNGSLTLSGLRLAHRNGYASIAIARLSDGPASWHLSYT